MHVPRYRVWLYTFLACIGMLMPALPVDAGTPTYAGNLQVMNGASLTYANGASGCLLAVSGVVTVMPCPVGTVAFSASSPFTVTDPVRTSSAARPATQRLVERLPEQSRFLRRSL